LINKSLNILIRTDSSKQIGLGHVMRDLVLAKQFASNGHNVCFACLPLPGHAMNKIQDKGFGSIILDKGSDEELVSIIKTYQIDLLIIDHYQIEKTTETYIKQKTQALVFIVDDLYTEHDCDFLLNHNISGDAARYQGKVSEECLVMAGPEYALLREEFRTSNIVSRTIEPGKEVPIFVSFGGSDPTNLSTTVINLLQDIPQIQLHIFTTTSNAHLSTLKIKSEQSEKVVLHINEANLAAKMQTCAFALVSPSVSCLEALFMELPLIAIKVVSNQQNTFNFLKKHQLFALDLSSIDHLKSLVLQLIDKESFEDYYQYSKQIKEQYFNTQNKSIYELVIAKANDQTEDIRNHHDSGERHRPHNL